MSAYIEEPAHINVVVSYFTSRVTGNGLWHEFSDGYNYMTPQNAHEVADLLYNQNVRSVNHRYNELTGNEGYNFEYIEGVRERYSIAEIGKALDGLEYQSCETDDYHQTAAYQVLHEMRKALLSQLYDQADVAGEAEHTWSISEVRKSDKVYL